MLLKLFVKAQSLLHALRYEHGQGIVEYTLLAALMSIVSIGVLTSVGTHVSGKYGTITAAIS
jgi:Flp pilus assembly pilin Flp